MENERYSSHDNRRLKIQFMYGFMLAVIFAVGVHQITDRVTTSFITMCFVTSVFIMIFIGCDLMLRLCRALIALTDANRQPGENPSSILSWYFALNIPSAAVIGIGVLLLLGLIITVRRYPSNHVWNLGSHACITSMIFSFLLLRATNLAEWETRSAMSNLDNMKGLDYGTGMAYSYYYGYLRLVLPSTGTASKGIVEKIENFEDNHNVTFPVHKLFILIPSSAYIPPNLKEASDQWMESAHELEEEKRSRAGIIGRKYHNNVYKIYPGGQYSGVDPQYVVVEGASPLLTFYEVQKHSHPESATYKLYKKDVVLTFYKKLREILQSEPDTRDLCEIICYNDHDANGNKTNVAELILERISKIKSSSM